MRALRKLYLKNASGERRSLTGEAGIFATRLSGFGYSLSPTFADLGSGFFPVTSEKNDLRNNLTFALFLTKNPYAVHQSLIDWISAAGKLTIVYNPTGAQEYSRDVIVNYIQKGELNAVGWLELLCSFVCITPWYKPTPASLNVVGSGRDERIRYPYRYTADLRYGSDSTASVSAFIAGSGHIPGALRMSFRGAVTSPRIRLYSNSTGKTYGTCKIDTVLTELDTLEFSTVYEDSYIRKVSQDGSVIDLLDCVDLNSEPFFHIPVDDRCTLVVESDAPFSGRANLLIYSYYRSV